MPEGLSLNSAAQSVGPHAKARAGIDWRQYALAFGAFAASTIVNLWLQKWLGYEAIALVYLLAVVVLALFIGRGPILFGTVLTALAWNFLFVSPRYSFHIAGTYDKMMFATYFVVALTVGELTTRLRNQREAAIQAKLLLESERLGRTLLNSVSHELRTPIAAITSAASGLRDDAGLTPMQNRLVVEIEAAVTRLNRFVQNLLSAARVRSGQIRPNMDWCDVPDLIRTAMRDVEGLLAGRSVEVHVAPRLPLVKMDFVLMQQALINLLSNAAVHTPPGTPVEVSAQMEGTCLVLQVADRGPGPGSDHERIFDLFRRGPTAKPGGTGLGLAIVKGFVEAQGARVNASNRPGGGARFTISVPAGDQPELPEENS